MDSQDSSAAPPPPPQLLHPQFHHHPQQQPPPSAAAMLMAAQQSQLHPNSYPPLNNNNNILHHHQQQQHQQQQPRFPFNSMGVGVATSAAAAAASNYSDGGGSSSPTGGEPAKKKRGRPRKYSPDGAGSSIALGLSPTGPINSVVGLADSSGGGGGGSGTGGALSSETPAKKHRGRPPGSGKKQLDALGAPGIGFTPHVITVNAGEDIASKIMAFSQQGPRTVCILSANGAICNVTLRQPAMSGGTVTYEGRFEIISLSGSLLLSENNGSRSKTGGLSVSLAGSDGRVLGGGVAGMLMAASPVQVIVGSFIADGKKPKSATPSSAPVAGPPSMLNFGNPAMAASPPSQDGSSDSSADNGSPIDRNAMAYGNASQPMQNMAMYANMGWGNSAMKMHPN